MKSYSIFDLPCVRPLGRYHQPSARSAGALPLFWAGSGLELCFTGSELHLLLEADFSSAEPWIAAELNGAPVLRMPLNQGVQDVCVFRGMTPGVPKHVRVFKETQPVSDDPAHRLWVRKVSGDAGEFLPLPAPACRLEFVGDSLTSGEGVIGARKEEDWVPALFSASRTWAKQCADLMRADFRLISQSGWGVRSGWDNDPGHTLPGIYERICGPALGEENQKMGAQQDNGFALWQPDAILINLGTNDAGAMNNPAWQGPVGQRFQQKNDPDGLAAFADAAVDFLKMLRQHNPAAKLVWAYGMADAPLQSCLEGAVERFCRETGEQSAYYLPLPGVTEDTMGSRQHPGPLCHAAAARTAAQFLKQLPDDAGDCRDPVSAADCL
ncbi:MAG: GDSL family lipase [Oscillospiraceae bacterium]|nr:GDSL family lipase [Oscillospiraceae bacterium]